MKPDLDLMLSVAVGLHGRGLPSPWAEIGYVYQDHGFLLLPTTTRTLRSCNEEDVSVLTKPYPSSQVSQTPRLGALEHRKPTYRGKPDSK